MIFLLELKGAAYSHPDWCMTNVILVRAASESEARQLANDSDKTRRVAHAVGQGNPWLDPALCDCTAWPAEGEAKAYVID